MADGGGRFLLRLPHAASTSASQRANNDTAKDKNGRSRIKGRSQVSPWHLNANVSLWVGGDSAAAAELWISGNWGLVERRVYI